MSLVITERYISERLDGTFTRVGGRRETLPPGFMPSHRPPGPRLTEAWATEILRVHDRGVSKCQISRSTVLPRSTVRNLVSRKTWTHLKEVRRP